MDVELFKPKPLLIYDRKADSITFHEFLKTVPKDYVGFIFDKQEREHIGKSEAKPHWGDVFYYEKGNLSFINVAIYKEHNYDYPTDPYSEKLWSLFGKTMLPNVRVANTEILSDPTNYYHPATFSYKLLDSKKEEGIDMADVMFLKFSREELLKMNGLINLHHLLECVSLQVTYTVNYKQLEENIVQTLLADAVSGNPDRHINNWMLVRDKATNWYELALYDHSLAFLDVIYSKPWQQDGCWSYSYIMTDSNFDNWKQRAAGISGRKVISYIASAYPKHFYNFMQIFYAEIDDFIGMLEEIKLPFNINSLKNNMLQKKAIIKTLMVRGDDNEER